ncbi:MAG: hypothetical protein ACRD1W_12055 [Vicinamibacterales bacterium]
MNLKPPGRRLSIGTLFYKKVVPLIWVAFAAAVAAITVWRLATGTQEQSPFELMPLLVLAGIAFVWTRLRGAGLADEVFDGGDHLVVRVGPDEERVSLGTIEDVKESRLMKQPPQLELVLTHPGKFGRVISFIPTGYTLLPLTKSPLFYELKERTSAARRKDGRA